MTKKILKKLSDSRANNGDKIKFSLISLSRFWAYQLQTCSTVLFFFAETFRSFLLRHFGHLSHSCIKTRHNNGFSLYFQTFWSKWLNLFRSFQKRFGSMTEKLLKKRVQWLISRHWKRSPSFHHYVSMQSRRQKGFWWAYLPQTIPQIEIKSEFLSIFRMSSPPAQA